MADNRSRRERQRPQTPQRSSTKPSKSKAATPRNRQRSTPRTRHGIKPQSQVTTLPSDLWTQLLPFLTWRDTSAMRSVCCEWRRVVDDAKKRHPEWRSTVLGPSVNGLESLELLRINHLKWADTRFAPDLVLLSAASKDPSPWHSGGCWEEAVAAIEEARLLPPTCRIVMMFTLNVVLGTSEEMEEEETSSSAVTLSISVAHLPETTLEMAEFDRKDLRRSQRGVGLDNPFTALDEMNTPCFMLCGVNDQSADQLVLVLEEWYPKATVVGAVSPLIDRCVPLATYKAPVGSPDRKPRRKRATKQQQRRPRPRGQVVFPSTMLLRLNGNVGIKSVSSSGYYPITPVIRCERASVAEELSQVVTYDLVSTSEGSQYRIMDLIEPSERIAIEQEGRTLNIFSCADSAPLEHLIDCNANKSTLTGPTSACIDRLEFIVWVQDQLMTLPGLCWQEGDYGVLASHHPSRTSQALSEALQSTRSDLSERVFGAFMVAGALTEVEDSVHAKQVSEVFTDVFQDLQMGGCIVSSSVGPVAFPGGLQTPVERRYRAQVQTHTTCGAIFYTTQ
ncbi:Leucine-rich repeat domain, L domain-like [Phytophthora cactorum]|nr:Leucine-rich repeat domain, L domain-like [Phytophthora cactorum]KAF1794510.1 Leucine-rich repeat domain, L domain-like [Phytophthora cactorum]